MRERYSFLELWGMKDRYIYIFALGAQGLYGDNTTPEPSVFNIGAHMWWNEWNKLKGLP